MTLRESDIQRAIMDWLTTHGVTWWRVPLAGIFHQIGGKRILKRNPMRGHPDLAGVIGGIYFAIEVKRPGGKLSEVQHEWARRLRAAGAVYIVATSVGDVRARLATIIDPGANLRSTEARDL